MTNTKEVKITFRGVDKTRAAFGRMKKNFHDMEKLSARVTKGFGGIGMALGLTFGGQAIKQIINTGDQIGKLSTRLGVSTEALSELKHVAELSGVEFSSLSTGLQRMTRRISEAASGTGAARKALVELGVSAQYLNTLRPEEQFEHIVESLTKVENQSDKVRLAMKLFDTEGVALLQTMENGAEGIRKMREEARKLGLSLSEQDTKAMADFNDAVHRLQMTLTGLMTSVLLPILPYIVAFFDVIREGSPAITFMITAISSMIALRLAAWLGSAVMAFRALTLAMLANPFGLIATGISLIVAGLVSLTDWFNWSGDAAKDHSAALEETVEAQNKLIDTQVESAMKKQNELQQEYKKILEDTKAPMQEHLQQKQEMNDLITQTAKGNAEYNDSITSTTSQLEQTNDVATKLFANIKESSNIAADDLLNHFTSAISGVDGQVKSLNDIFNNLFDSISQGIINTLTGGMSFSQGISSMLGGLMGGGSNSGGGGGLFDGVSSIFGGFFAKGGTVKPGRMHVVGEKEPELFIPNSVGSIIPASSAMTNQNASEIVVNMNVQTPDLASFNYSRSQLAADMARQVMMSRRNL